MKIDTLADPRCPYCGADLAVTRMSCRSCKVSIEAEFPPSRLARLPLEHQRFIELFLLADGSLKEIAERAGVSYPTVRSRLDKVIEALRREIAITNESKEQSGRGEESTQELARVIKAI